MKLIENLVVVLTGIAFLVPVVLGIITFWGGVESALNQDWTFVGIYGILLLDVHPTLSSLRGKLHRLCL